MRIWIVLAGLFGTIGVLGDTYAAHGLDELNMEYWQGLMYQASLYFLLHAAVFIGIGALYQNVTRSCEKHFLLLAGGLMVLGNILFGGTLFYRAFTLGGVLPIPLLTPIGGICVLLGWVALLAYGLWLFKNKEPAQ